MVVESTFELEFSRNTAVMTDFDVQIWRPSELHSFYYKNEDISYYSTVVFVCTVQRFTKIFFPSNNIRRPLKMAFCGCSFSSKLALKYVK